MVMIFKNYCGVFFNPVIELNSIVSKISEDSPRVMKGKGISIYTFTSVIDVAILTDYFKSHNFNFFIFDLSKSNSGFNFTDKEKESDLFNFLNDTIKSDFELLSNTLMDDIIKNSNLTSTPKINEPIIKDKNNIIKEGELNIILNSIENMSKDDRNNMLNEIIDKGIQNLDDSDKKILEKISKYQ
jgi:hypothetical protein